MSVHELYVAIDSNNTDLVLSLLEKSDIRQNMNQNFYGSTCLKGTCYQGNMRVTQALLEAGADIGVLDNTKNTTPLHWANHGNLDCMSALTDHNSDVNVRNMHGYTPLHLSSKYGFADCIEILLQAKCTCSLNVCDELELTSLHLACHRNKLELVKLLVKHRADVNTQVCQNAAEKGKVLIEFLV